MELVPAHRYDIMGSLEGVLRLPSILQEHLAGLAYWLSHESCLVMP
jgi:hypothetical protein